MANKYTTVKQVDRAIRKHLGPFATIQAEAADGRFGRIYKVMAVRQGPLSANRFEAWERRGTTYEWAQQCEGWTNVLMDHPKLWIQGGLDRKGLLEWANECLINEI